MDVKLTEEDEVTINLPVYPKRNYRLIIPVQFVCEVVESDSVEYNILLIKHLALDQ